MNTKATTVSKRKPNTPIGDVRWEKGISQPQLAEIIGVWKFYDVSDYEHAKRFSTNEERQKIACALGITVTELQTLERLTKMKYGTVENVEIDRLVLSYVWRMANETANTKVHADYKTVSDDVNISIHSVSASMSRLIKKGLVEALRDDVVKTTDRTRNFFVNTKTSDAIISSVGIDMTTLSKEEQDYLRHKEPVKDANWSKDGDIIVKPKCIGEVSIDKKLIEETESVVSVIEVKDDRKPVSNVERLSNDFLELLSVAPEADQYRTQNESLKIQLNTLSNELRDERSSKLSAHLDAGQILFVGSMIGLFERLKEIIGNPFVLPMYNALLEQRLSNWSEPSMIDRALEFLKELKKS